MDHKARPSERLGDPPIAQPTSSTRPCSGSISMSAPTIPVSHSGRVRLASPSAPS
jgi:hypothetical protein